VGEDSEAEPTIAADDPSDATLLDPAVASSPGTGASDAASAELVSAREVEEIVRTISLYRVIVPLCILTLAALAVSPATLIARVPSAIAVGTSFAVTIALLFVFRDRSRFRLSLVLAHGLLTTVTILTCVVFFGVFSPAIMTVCVGIYFFGQSNAPRHGSTIYATCALGYLTLTVLALVGVVPLDRSVAAIDRPDVAGLAAIAVIAQAILALTFWMAVRSRAATRRAFGQVVRAASKLRERDAVLAEVRADLDVVRRTAEGRYTGRALGDYRVMDIIGRGAMGEVYRATDVSRGRSAALKVLSAASGGDSAYVERFVREARIASSIRSPYCVEIYGTGQTDDGGHYIAMELLEGEDLAEHLRKVHHLEADDVITLVTEIGEALAAGDAAGVVHRDVKPQNVFRLAQPVGARWKILDFGVSKLREAAATLTQGQVIGTPSYMAPEQARGGKVDHRSDVFGLGAVAYRAIAGRPAFTGPDSAATIYNVLYVQTARPGQNVQVPEDVEAVLALALAKDPQRRFQTTPLFAAALRAAYRGELDVAVRESARRLLAAQPWGTDTLAARPRRSWHSLPPPR